MRVLIVDDDELNCEIINHALIESGYETCCASDGLAAVEAMKSHPCPLIVCDWEMPRLDGPGFCKWLRGSEYARSTYLIMLTARQGMENSANGLVSGADVFLNKPFDCEELLDHLRLGAKLLHIEANRRVA